MEHCATSTKTNDSLTEKPLLLNHKKIIMKLQIHVLCFLALMLYGFTGYSQVYKTAEDTVKLNKEFTDVSNDIANLTARLEVAQNNMPGVRSKAANAETNAQEAAVTSSNQA